MDLLLGFILDHVPVPMLKELAISTTYVFLSTRWMLREPAAVRPVVRFCETILAMVVKSLIRPVQMTFQAKSLYLVAL